MDEQDSGSPETNANQEEGSANHVVPIVGIGASAGGVDALRRLLFNVHPGCGMALVIVQHLDPDHDSALAEILARATVLPVTTVENNGPAESEHVYVIPPTRR